MGFCMDLKRGVRSNYIVGISYSMFQFGTEN